MTMRVVFATCLFLFVTCAASAQEQLTAPKNEALERFVGAWNLKSMLKPAKWNPDGAETTGKEFLDMDITATRKT